MCFSRNLVLSMSFFLAATAEEMVSFVVLSHTIIIIILQTTEYFLLEWLEKSLRIRNRNTCSVTFS